MKTVMVGIVVLALTVSGARAAVFSSSFAGPSLPIPDYDPKTLDALAISLPVSASGTILVNVTVQLAISSADGYGTFNGDLFAYLKHRDGIAYLLNRPGRTDADEFGYAESDGFRITLDETATGGFATGIQDIHVYRRELSPTGDDDSIPLTGPLTGTWRPDGRAVDPEGVRDTDLRTAGLDVFTGMDPNGTWTLYVQDFGVGGRAQLDSVTITGVAIPELSEGTLLTAVGLGGLALLAGRRSSRQRSR